MLVCHKTEPICHKRSTCCKGLVKRTKAAAVIVIWKPQRRWGSYDVSANYKRAEQSSAAFRSRTHGALWVAVSTHANRKKSKRLNEVWLNHSGFYAILTWALTTAKQGEQRTDQSETSSHMLHLKDGDQMTVSRDVTLLVADFQPRKN